MSEPRESLPDETRVTVQYAPRRYATSVASRVSCVTFGTFGVLAIAWSSVFAQGGPVLDGVLVREQLGAQQGGRFGLVTTTLRDLDGDGLRDYAVGAPCDGRVRIYSAGSGALIREIPAEGIMTAHGAALGAADVNGDGLDDLLVGAPLFDPPNVVSCFPGKTYVYSGADGSLLYTSVGQVQGAGHGTAVAGLGDVSGDGVDDFAVGAPNQFGLGLVTVYSGSTGVPLYSIPGDNASPFLGQGIVSMGDLDGDGRGDFAVRSLSSIVVYSGAMGSVHMIFNQAVTGLANAGDVDGDGINDLAFGGGPGNSAGPVSVVSGDTGNGLYVVASVAEPSGFGIVLSSAGDTNGDGTPDLAIGAPRVTSSGGSSSVGAVYVFSGTNGTLLWRFTDGQPGSQSGISLAPLDDLNCDGAPELLVGADFWSSPAMQIPGAVLVLAAPPVVAPRFVRGDGNGDGVANLPDAVALLNFLFSGTALVCASAADANDDGRLNLADVVTELGSLFLSAGPLPAPYPSCGTEDTLDLLCCDVSPCP